MKAEVSKVDYSSKAKGSNIRDFLAANNTVHAATTMKAEASCRDTNKPLDLQLYGFSL